MTTLSATDPHHLPAVSTRPADKPASGRALGALFVAEALLAFAPLVILGAAIGWPASLDKPAAEQLAAIGAAPGGVQLGYGVYLLYSVLIAPLMIGLAARVFGGLGTALGATVAVFAALSVLARAIGILRWLTVMPALAAAHAAAGPAERASIELVFDAVTAYGGGTGELLGVGVFMALALAGLAWGAWRRGTLPRWCALGAGLVALMLLSLLLPALGLPGAAPMALAVSSLSVWMLATGVWLLRRG